METDRVAAHTILRDARLRSQLSQTELARRAGIAQSVISAYESGRREPSFATLTKMVDATGHSLVIDLVSNRSRILGLPDTPIGRRLRRNRASLIATSARHGVTNLRVFGSVVRGENTSQSDVDIVADFPTSIGLLELGELERELSETLRIRVDLMPYDDLRPHVRAEVDAEAIPL